MLKLLSNKRIEFHLNSIVQRVKNVHKSCPSLFGPARRGGRFDHRCAGTQFCRPGCGAHAPGLCLGPDPPKEFAMNVAAAIDVAAPMPRHKTVPVQVGDVTVGAALPSWS